MQNDAEIFCRKEKGSFVTVDHRDETLKKDFANFVRDRMLRLGYTTLYLCGPNTENACSLMIREEGTRSVKIGMGWKEFCKMNNFRKGNKLKFEFLNVHQKNVVVVKRI